METAGLVLRMPFQTDGCLLARVYHKLSVPDQDRLDRAIWTTLPDGKYLFSSRVLSGALANIEHPVSRDVILDHRGGSCACVS